MANFSTKFSEETPFKAGFSQDINFSIQMGNNSEYVLPPATAETLGGIKVGDNLKISGGVLSVDTSDTVEADNTKPVTSGAVQVVVGNIDVLLGTI